MIRQSKEGRLPGACLIVDRARVIVAEEERDLPTTNHPLHGPRRPLAKPIVAVIALVVVVVVVVLLLTWLRYNT